MLSCLADHREDSGVGDATDFDVDDRELSDSENLDSSPDMEISRDRDSSGDPVPDDFLFDMSGCTPLPTSGSLVLNGELDTDLSPQWNLPNTADCTVDTGGDSPALYALYHMCNTGPERSYDILAEGGRDDPSLTMGGIAIFIYKESGLPTDPTSCVAQTNNVGEDVALIDAYNVPTGRGFTVIASSYSYVIDGTFRITISVD